MGLPKPKDWISSATNDLPLLFTPDEVQQFALEHRLNKSQTKVIGELQKAAPEFFKEIVSVEPEQAIQRIVELSEQSVGPVQETIAPEVLQSLPEPIQQIEKIKEEERLADKNAKEVERKEKVKEKIKKDLIETIRDLSAGQIRSAAKLAREDNPTQIESLVPSQS